MLNSLFHGLQMQIMRCGFSALPGHYVVFFGNSFTLIVPQFIHDVYKWVPAVRRLLSSSSLHVSSTIFSSTIKTTKLPPPSQSSFLFISVQLTSVSLISAKNLSKLFNAIHSAVCEESVVGFEPIRNLTKKNFE